MLYILFIVGNALALFFLYLYFKQTESTRLKEIVQIVREIGDGNISQSVLEKKDGFGELACAVNDMAINIQEILILLWKQNAQAVRLLNRIPQIMQETDDNGQEHREEIIRQCVEILRSHEDSRNLFREFQFFGVDLNADGACGITNNEKTD